VKSPANGKRPAGKNHAAAHSKDHRKEPRKDGGGSKKRAPGEARRAAPRGPGRPSQGAEAEKAYPPSARVIKRYGNRRLYDAQLSRCVTMTEIADMVRAHEDVRVVDGDSGEDLTKRVLVQLILEQQNATQLELLPVELLHQIIAVRSAPIAGWLGQYLQAGAEFLDRQSKAAAPTMRGMTDSFGNLFPWLNPESWKGQPGAAEMAAAFAEAARGKQPGTTSEGATESKGEGESGLRNELADLQKRFADLTAKLMRP
jgi:polyhydroxyalkanoate synthesis repressor PhaR